MDIWGPAPASKAPGCISLSVALACSGFTGFNVTLDRCDIYTQTSALAQASGCPRCLAAMRLWHGTLLGVSYALHTSGVAFPFVIERLSNTPARPQEASPHTWEAV